MDNNQSLKQKTISGLFWSFMERIGAQLISFIVSIVLARLLDPAHFGIIAIVNIFINILNIFVNSSFSRALVQKKDADDLDFSSVLYFNIVFSIVLYAGLFFASPFIASFYKDELLTPILRVMGLSLLILSVKSVQHAYVSRQMQFKKFFWATLGGTLTSAIIGIYMAYKGFGVWALVAQYLSNHLIDTIVLIFMVKWRPKLMFSFKRLKGLLSYGWKVLLSGLISAIYEDIRGLIIGKRYSSEDLAYYDRGRKFPSLIAININSSITSTMLPVASKLQDNKALLKQLVRKSITISAYLMMPFMFGLAVVAKPLVLLLLGEVWLPCVPFIQIMCINFALLPIQTANLQAIYGTGRSDIALKLEIIKKSFGLLMVLLTFRIGVTAIALGTTVSAVFASIVNSFPNKKLLGYSYFEQIKDILPYVAMSAVMVGGVFLVSLIPIPSTTVMLQISILALQVLVGAIIYIALSIIFKVKSFYYIINIIKPFLKKLKRRKTKC